LKKIAIIGKPNVGKSSLFNRIAREKDAITSEVSGTTRDIKKRDIIINDREATLLDTGGFDTSSELFETVTEKALKTAEESDIILYMVDGRKLAEEDDRKRFFQLKKKNPNIALVVNKLDNDKMEEAVWDFASFGVDEIFPISISHNRKVNRLLNWVYDKLGDESVQEDFEPEEDFLLKHTNEIYMNSGKTDIESEINVAIIGRVNVGKSSLLNAITKSDRCVVSSVAGTTIDPIDEVMELDGKSVKFVDTAGIRRRGRIDGIEKYALMRTEAMLERSHIAILVLDATEEFKELDEKIAGLVDKHHLATIIVLNKWDKSIYEYDMAVQIIRDKFKFLYFAPIITLSALTHKRVHKLQETIFKVHKNYTQRVSTSQLNKVVENAVLQHSLPAPKGRMLKIYYSTQYETSPPRIAVVMNHPKLLHFSYKRYLINQFRREFDFEGAPIMLIARAKSQREKKEEVLHNSGFENGTFNSVDELY
jgi:GTP-binding protein